MGMMQPTEVEQRGQMAFMMLGRVVELFGAFGNIVQMVFGSIAQFMGSYVGLSQQYKQINDPGEDEPLLDPHGQPLQYNEDGTFVSHRGGMSAASLARKRRKQLAAAAMPAPEGPVRKLLQRMVLLLAAYFIVTRLLPRLRKWAGV
jgi:hypothetical protein